MKMSRYNIHFIYNKNIVLYNSLSDLFILFNPLLFDLLKAGKTEDRICDIKNVNALFYDALLNYGFIVEKTKDEFS